MSTATIYTQTLTEAQRLYEGMGAMLHYMQLGTDGMPGGEFGVVVYTVMALTVALAFLKIKDGISPFVYLGGFAIPILVFTALFAARIDVRFETFEGQTLTYIEDVPLGLALPMETMSIIEKSLVEAVDDWMLPVDIQAHSFAKWDFLGQIKATKTMMNTDFLRKYPHIQSTLDEYFENCMLYAMKNGGATSLRNSSDLLTDSGVSYRAFFTTVYSADGGSVVSTCADAYSVLRGDITSVSMDNDVFKSVARDIPKYKDSIFTKDGSPGALTEARSMVDGLMDSLFTGFQSNTESAMQQMIMINGIRSNLAQTSPEMLIYWGQASASQRTSSIISSIEYVDMMNRFRPMLKLAIVLMFPLFGAFFVTQNGRPFLGWISALLWVSIWLPMESIIHAAYAHYFIGGMRDIGGATEGITWNNVVTMNDLLATNADAGAQLIFFLIPLSGMVLSFIAPKAATAVGGMIAGTHRLAASAQSAGGNAMSQAQGNAKELEADKINKSMMMVSDKYMTQLSSAKKNWEMLGGKASPFNLYNDNSANVGSGSYEAFKNMVGSISASGGFNSADSTALGIALSRTRASMDSTSKSLAYTFGDQGNYDVARAINRNLRMTAGTGSGLSESESVKTAENLIKSSKWGKTLEDSEVKDLAKQMTAHVAAGAKASLEFDTSKNILGKIASFFTGASAKASAGIDVGMDAKRASTEKTAASDKQSLQQAEDAVASLMKDSGFQESVKRDFGLSADKGATDSSSLKFSKGYTLNDALQAAQNESLSYQRQNSLNHSLSKILSTGGQVNVAVDRGLASASAAGLAEMARRSGLEGKFGSFFAGLENRESIDMLRARFGDTFAGLSEADKGRVLSQFSSSDVGAHGHVFDASMDRAAAFYTLNGAGIKGLSGNDWVNKAEGLSEGSGYDARMKELQSKDVRKTAEIQYNQDKATAEMRALDTLLRGNTALTTLMGVSSAADLKGLTWDQLQQNGLYKDVRNQESLDALAEKYKLEHVQRNMSGTAVDPTVGFISGFFGGHDNAVENSFNSDYRNMNAESKSSMWASIAAAGGENADAAAELSYYYAHGGGAGDGYDRRLQALEIASFNNMTGKEVGVAVQNDGFGNTRNVLNQTSFFEGGGGGMPGLPGMP